MSTKDMQAVRKILFLDFDGVLNTSHWGRNATIDRSGYVFDPNAVANLAEIIRETGAEIVVSSSWKSMGLAMLQDMWKARKLPGKVIDVTPNAMSDELLLHADLDNLDILSLRGQEIKEWLMQNGTDVSHYAILDDMNDILHEQEPHFVWIDPEVGITTGNAVQAIMILKHVNR